MKDDRLLPDDPKLTAYALGELTGDERAAVEAALRQNPALRLVVEELRATAARIEAALAEEPLARPATPAGGRPGVVLDLNGYAADAAGARKLAPRAMDKLIVRRTAARRNASYDNRRMPPKLLRFPQFYYVAATFAAACFAVAVALRDDPPRAATPVERTIRHEIVFTPSTTATGSPTVIMTIPGAVEIHGDATTRPESANEKPIEPPRPPSSSLAHTAPAPSSSFPDGGQSRVAPTNNDAEVRVAETTPMPMEEIGASAFTPDEARSPGRAGTNENRVATVTTRVARAPGTEDLESTRPISVPSLRGGLLEQSADRLDGDVTGASNPPPLFADALTPPVAGPVVAGSTLPSLIPHQVGGARSTITPSASGDIVMLSPFTVTEDRATGFATASSSHTLASDRRGGNNRDDRPHAPPGARFGRNTESYSYIRDNDFLFAAQNQLSTFSIDVDSASYANVRRMLEHGSLPPRDAVRIEEMLNYFPYRYRAPKDDAPFAASLEVAEAPWAPTHRLVRIGLKAREVSSAQRAPASLVFLLDVSGSMNQPNKLPLVKHSLRLLIGKLRPDDRVAIVTYAGNSGLALAPTPVSRSRDILNALDGLEPSGSTNGAMGINLAYEIAKASFVQDGINRVILCTDGDFNVGTTSEGELVRLVQEQATSGVFLTVLGFGMGNYKDATLEKLADNGNGNYGYIDTAREAEKLLVEQVSSTLVTVAKDVKIQVEFNPATVSSYRLIGYENRLLRKEDFNNDRVDAGEIGAGHTVTALYEIVPVGAEDKLRNDDPPLDELRYGARGAVSSRLEMPGKRDPLSNELLTVKVRYKKPDSLFSFPKTLQFPLIDATTAFARASADFRFAAAVAQFGMILRGSPHRGIATLGDVAAWAAAAATTPADDPGGYRGEFVELVRKAQTLLE